MQKLYLTNTGTFHRSYSFQQWKFQTDIFVLFHTVAVIFFLFSRWLTKAKLVDEILNVFCVCNEMNSWSGQYHIITIHEYDMYQVLLCL